MGYIEKLVNGFVNSRIKNSWDNYKGSKNITSHEKDYVVKVLDFVEKDSIRFRISNLLKWYIDKAESSKRMYYIFNIAALLSNAAIPILALSNNNGAAKIFVSILAAIAGVSLSINNLGHYKENWTNYRKCAEGIKQAVSAYSIKKEIYLTLNGSKNDLTPANEKYIVKLEQELLTEIDTIVSLEGKRWFEIHSKQEEEMDTSQQ